MGSCRRIPPSFRRARRSLLNVYPVSALPRFNVRNSGRRESSMSSAARRGYELSSCMKYKYWLSYGTNVYVTLQASNGFNSSFFRPALCQRHDPVGRPVPGQLCAPMRAVMRSKALIIIQLLVGSLGGAPLHSETCLRHHVKLQRAGVPCRYC